MGAPDVFFQHERNRLSAEVGRLGSVVEEHHKLETKWSEHAQREEQSRQKISKELTHLRAVNAELVEALQVFSDKDSWLEKKDPDYGEDCIDWMWLGPRPVNCDDRPMGPIEIAQAALAHATQTANDDTATEPGGASDE